MFRYLEVFLPMFVALFWTIVILSDKIRGSKAKVALAVFMSTATVLYFAHAAFFLKEYKLYSIMDAPYTFASLAVFPMFYIYIRFLSVDTSFNYKFLWILLPAFYFSISSATIYWLFSSEELQSYIHQVIYKENMDFQFSTLGKFQIANIKISRIVFILQLFPVIYFGSGLINSYNKKISEYYSSVEGKTLNWIRILLWVLLITGLFSAMVNIIGKSYFVNYPLLLMIPSIIFSVMLFMIGLLGYKQNYTIQNYQAELLKFDNSHNVLNCTQNSNFSHNRDRLKSDFVNLLEEKELFRKNDLRITDVSTLLNSNRSYVSNMVNSEFNCSFSDLINRYRVDYAKKILLDPKMYILDYVADGSGFASVNSLLRAFRKETGMTPGEFRKINK